MPQTGDVLALYGSYGFTGSLIAHAAVEAGVPLLLCGRNGRRLAAQAARLSVDYCVASLDEPASLDSAFSRVRAVLNCAGPIADTVDGVVEACLRARVHYLDLSGEMEVFERLQRRSTEARDAGIALVPGVGFDVVPTDCLALHVARRLPEASFLELAVQGVAGMSRGTALTMLQAAPRGGYVRRQGALVQVPAGWRTKTLDLGAGPVPLVSVPLADLSSAYYTTGIPNITTYAAGPTLLRQLLRSTRVLRPLLASAWVQRGAAAALSLAMPPPKGDRRRQAIARVWAQAVNSEGRTATARMRTPEPYTLTVATALESARRAANGRVPPGFHTPALAFGPDYVLEFPDVVREDL